jgi:hypothetical protein
VFSLHGSVPDVTPYGSMGRLSMKRWVSVAIVAMTLMSTTGYAADGVGVCGTIRLGETTVATARRQRQPAYDGFPYVWPCPSLFRCQRDQARLSMPPVRLLASRFVGVWRYRSASGGPL